MKENKTYYYVIYWDKKYLEILSYRSDYYDIFEFDIPKSHLKFNKNSSVKVKILYSSDPNYIPKGKKYRINEFSKTHFRKAKRLQKKELFILSL